MSIAFYEISLLLIHCKLLQQQEYECIYIYIYIYIYMLDASKAFDRVHFGKLFNLLRTRNLPPLYLRLLLLLGDKRDNSRN